METFYKTGHKISFRCLRFFWDVWLKLNPQSLPSFHFSYYNNIYAFNNNKQGERQDQHASVEIVTPIPTRLWNPAIKCQCNCDNTKPGHELLSDLENSCSNIWWRIRGEGGAGVFWHYPMLSNKNYSGGSCWPMCSDTCKYVDRSICYVSEVCLPNTCVFESFLVIAECCWSVFRLDSPTCVQVSHLGCWYTEDNSGGVSI